jgi:hypothetical protein
VSFFSFPFARVSIFRVSKFGNRGRKMEKWKEEIKRATYDPKTDVLVATE